MNLLNWCNKVLARIVISRNLLRRLQSILNAAARFSVGKSDRFTPLLHTCWRFRMRSFSDHEYWRTGACTTLHCHRPTLPSHFNRQLMWMVQVFISLDPWIPACACRLQHIVQREFPVAAACLQGSVPFAIAVVLRCHSFCSDIFFISANFVGGGYVSTVWLKSTRDIHAATFCHLPSNIYVFCRSTVDQYQVFLFVCMFVC